MSGRLLAFISAILLCETGVFVGASYLAATPLLVYQLAARFSARISFFIFFGILLWTGLQGLRSVYATERYRRLFVELLLLFAINHVVHLYFLSMNFLVQGPNMLSARNAGGAVVYLILIVAPAYLWKRQALNRRLYLFVYAFFGVVVSLFFLTYLGRLTKVLPQPSSQTFFITALAAIGALVLLHGYRIWTDHTRLRQSVP